MAPVLLCSLATFGLILGVAVGAVRLTGWPGGLVPMVVVAAISKPFQLRYRFMGRLILS